VSQIISDIFCVKIGLSEGIKQFFTGVPNEPRKTCRRPKTRGQNPKTILQQAGHGERSAGSRKNPRPLSQGIKVEPKSKETETIQEQWKRLDGERRNLRSIAKKYDQQADECRKKAFEILQRMQSLEEKN